MVYDLASTKHVFSDWDLIEAGSGLARHDPDRRDQKPAGPPLHPTRELPHGVRISVHHPRIEPDRLIEPDTPEEGALICYVSVFEDDGLYRIYMMNWGDDVSEGWDDSSRGSLYDYMLAYAESSDGINWTKPSVGAVIWNGSTDNNLVYAGHAAPPFKDPNAPPDQRYKLVCMDTYNGRPCLREAVSADGLRFKTLETPILFDYGSDTHTVIRFDPDKGCYVGYFRGWGHGRRGLRTIAYAEADRFESWPTPEVIVTPDVLDHPDTDIYTNSHTLWPDADAQLMFPAFYERRLDVNEIHLMTSRDGLHWERPIRRPIIPVGEPGSGLEFNIYAGCELLNLRPGEWSLPISPRPNSHNQEEYPEGMLGISERGYVCWATWRQDGFTSLEAETEGSCATEPFTFSGNRLEVNAWSRFGGGIRIELADASSENMFSSSDGITAHTYDDCDPVTGDALKHTITWNGESDLSAWAGKPVRLRFRMLRARLHAFQFV